MDYVIGWTIFVVYVGLGIALSKHIINTHFDEEYGGMSIFIVPLWPIIVACYFIYLIPGAIRYLFTPIEKEGKKS